jgi:hypothetical protein
MSNDIVSELTYRAQTLMRTDRPGRYAAQAAKHFGHNCPTEWTGETGFVEFQAGRCEMATTAEGLLLTARAGTEAGLAQVQEVIRRHLERWGEKDELRVTWPQPDAA